MKAADFGDDFVWGVAIAAAQNEGAADLDGKGPSIWDAFARRSGKIKKGAGLNPGCDFYRRYAEDIALVKTLGFNIFRFSISWPRVLPEGTGKINEAGITFYHQVIDCCLENGLIPYITLYHWDLPEALENEGGWAAYSVNGAFNTFVRLCAKTYGDKVKNWIILNEPFGFTSLGYMLGIHAPGQTGVTSFFTAVHHAAMAQADGGRIIRSEVKNAHIGTTFSCSQVFPHSDADNDHLAAYRMDILLNRMFVEPLLGMGYPGMDWEVMEKFAISHSTWRHTEKLAFDFDFIGLQNYFPLTVKYNAFVPVVQAWEVKAKSRLKPHTAMGWEVNPDSFYAIIKQFAAYPGIPKLYITENGAAYADKLKNGKVDDQERIHYFELYLGALLRAKQEGLPVAGYMAWTLMDNFEWAEGYQTRFGLVYTDFKTQQRIIKSSGYWWQDFLRK